MRVFPISSSKMMMLSVVGLAAIGAVVWKCVGTKRSALTEIGRAATDRRTQERVDEYFACTDPVQRERILDRQIDEMGKNHQQFDALRQKTASTQAARKPRQLSRNADQRARRMAYHAAMQARMQERGIERRR